MNPRFMLTILLGNEAMTDAAGVAVALRQLADRLETPGKAWTDNSDHWSTLIRDANGNSVGSAHLDN